jgi:RNA polymerase sigma factor (sigma-70 family)
MTEDDFSKRYERGYRNTVRFLISRGLKSDLAEEIAQAAWVRGWEQRTQLREIQLLSTWVNTIALNLHRSQLRSSKQRELLPVLIEAVESSGTHHSLLAKETLELVSAQERMMLEAFFLQGFTTTEIAARHGLTEAAVRIRLFRARKAARRHATQEPAKELNRKRRGRFSLQPKEKRA